MAKRFKVIKGGAAKRGVTSSSSIKKKRVKEGNPRFIGPRQLQGELAEIETRASRDTSSRPRDSRTRMLGGDWLKDESHPDFESIGSERLKKMLMKILYKRGLKVPF